MVAISDPDLKDGANDNFIVNIYELIRLSEDDNYYNGDEIQLKLQKALLTLPDKQRLVFNMKYYDELKYEEISNILGTSVGALKASYHIAVGLVMAIILIGLFVISNQKREDTQITVEISFEDIMREYPEMIEYMDDNELIEFAASEMDGDAMGLIDLEPGFDSILLEDEWILNISDEEIGQYALTLTNAFSTFYTHLLN